MKQVIISMALILGAAAAQAATYNCVLSNGKPDDSKATTYSFDTAKEPNKFVDIGQGVAVGCVVLRAQSPLLSCGIGDGANFSISATTDDGASVLSFEAISSGTKSVLSCIKKP